MTCRMCSYDAHTQCRDPECSCGFPLHIGRPNNLGPTSPGPAPTPLPDAASDAEQPVVAAAVLVEDAPTPRPPRRRPRPARRHRPSAVLVADPDPRPTGFQGPTVHVPMVPSPPTIYAPPLLPPAGWPADPEIVVVERDRRVRRYKRMQPALVWLVRDLANRAGLDGEVWGDMTDRLLLDNGWSREAVGLLAQALTEELALAALCRPA